jgi:hypothetical protein
LNGTISYYNPDGVAVATQSFSVEAHASVPVYQGAAGVLPEGFYGTAVVSSSAGGAGGLVVTTNAQSAEQFYTYTLPTN